MPKPDTVGTAIVHYLCPVCEQPVDSESEVVINTRLMKADADKVNDLHQKAAGYAKKICESCHDEVGDGIYLVGVIEEKTDDKRNPYRSGDIIAVKRDAFERIFNQPAPEGQVCWTEDQIITWIKEAHENL